MTDWPTPWISVRCNYCAGRGIIHGHGSKPDRGCIPCGTVGRLPAPTCPLCTEPVLDTDTTVFSVGGVLVDPSGRAAHLSCLPITKPEEGQE